MTVASILWRRLDSPGHDASLRLEGNSSGWHLGGTAVFRQEGRPRAARLQAHLRSFVAHAAGTRPRLDRASAESSSVSRERRKEHGR